MPTACILHEHARVALTGERLVVTTFPSPEAAGGTDYKPDQTREIPLRDIDRVILGEHAHLTTPALTALLQAAIPIQVFSWTGRFLGGFLPAQNNHGAARLLQYRRTLEPAFARDMSGRIVTAKLYNQRRVLQRIHLSRKNSNPPEPSLPDDLDRTLAWLDALFIPLKNATRIDEIRGYEGAATARYFSAWASLLPAAFPFERRSTRPPHNPVNACISFASTLLYNEAVAFCHAHGLDPALGFLHTTENGRWSLALDLLEPFRPCFVEALALDLFSHDMLNDAHFEHRDGGCFLNESGRRKFILQYERRMERQFISEAVDHRTTLRLQLENQAVMLKTALDTPEKFEPFLMN